MKKCYCILMMSLFVFVGFSTSAFSATSYTGEEPAWMDPFADPQPVYIFDWSFGVGGTTTDINGKTISTSLSPNVGESRADGVQFSSSSSCYWTSLSGGVNSFSLTNDVGAWLDAIGTGNAVIRYSIREDYSGSGSVDNSDIVELFDNENEWLIMPGYTPGGANLGLDQSNDVTALEWNTKFDDSNVNWDLENTINSSYFRVDLTTWVGKNMDDETIYVTFGATGQVDGSGIQTGTTRAKKTWDGGAINGYYSGTTYYINPSGNTGESLLNCTFDGTNWYIPVIVSSTQYDQRMDLPYDGVNYPASSGAVIQWYDDYDLYLAGGGIANPGAYGVSGRYILERDEFLYTGSGTSYAHHADVCYEARTYQPLGNADGPESPYEWLYDSMGVMYVPTDTTAHPSPSSDPATRAYELIGNHPFWVDDDTAIELEHSYPDNEEYKIWKNEVVNYGTVPNGVEGAVDRGLFVDSWRLAGLMLDTVAVDMEFWNSGYSWDPKTGQVVDLGSSGDVLWDLSWYANLPAWTWNSTTSQWELPTTYVLDPYPSLTRTIWGWLPNEAGTPVAGYDVLNNFMRFVFDIDAVVVEDVDGDGEFDVGDDYVLFSVVDDGLYSMYNNWGTGTSDTSTPFGGQYFDGDTIFLYDGTSVTTFFDAATGIFFGNAISTATGAGAGSTLWSMFDIYDLDALDIGILPEPSTIFLMIGSASGLAVVAGFMRRKMR